MALGGDLAPATLIEAYSKGIFPWEGSPPIPWFSPDPRAILVPRAFRASRSLQKVARQERYRVSTDQAFDEVVAACANAPRRGDPGSWINHNIQVAYGELHLQGHAHSVEVWDNDELVGGLYGLAIGRAFFGESMFHTRPNASKLALWGLCKRLHYAGYRFVDCQQETGHLRSLGAVAIPRLRYLRWLEEAVGHEDRWALVNG